MNYEIVVVDDPEAGVLVAEIWFDGKTFAEVFEPPPYRVYIYGPYEKEAWQIPLPLLEEAIAVAKTRLHELQRRREE